MRLDPSDPRPAYQQVAADLRRAITSGKYQPGDRLPSGRLLARQYGLAPMTVASALGVLREEGLIASWQGRGVYVLEPGQRQGGRGAGAAGGEQRLADLEAEVAGLRRDVSELAGQVDGLRAAIGTGRRGMSGEPAGPGRAPRLPDAPERGTRRSR